ncbi:radical SAM family heme chaperone HemW [Clostridium rectalis]|uniref:radical SAM family heme chaperone HemW n=1 Tax=Clostridium rectalis TaxID=2040295 RepID=UPI000F630120|nr:radical SAM family heme chaperone HemW [Clostridium rectalis]
MKYTNKEIALYIHIPFCKQKCLYCDFPSHCNKEDLMFEYIEALCKELYSIKNTKIKSIFIGGGTPTYLDIKHLNMLKKPIDKLEKTKNIEFTVEVNPGTVDYNKLICLKELGVNRLSIGLQAWQDEILNKIGRVHSIKDFLEGYNKARIIGFNNINIDIMFGLPGQNMKKWKETLRNVVDLKPEHISCYSLIIEEGTPFYKMYEENKLELPNEEIEREMYKYCVDFLKDKGYYQYEISNFSIPNKECIHNLVYWDTKDYIGCGSAAHSFLDGLRYKHTDNIEEYIINVKANKNINLEEHKNSTKESMEEFMFMGLRKIKGINIEEFQKRFKLDIYEIYGNTIEKYLNNGLLINNNNSLSLSEEGIQVSNRIMCDFILN